MTSPNYPSNYSTNQICEWKIVPGTSCDGRNIELTVLPYELEPYYDNLKIKGTSLKNSVTLSGSGRGYPAQSTYFNVSFTSDVTRTRKGFKLKYRCAKTNWCETNPCFNGGTCDALTETCTCLYNHTGAMCDQSKVVDFVNTSNYSLVLVLRIFSCI